jgi:hypothetical protein
LFSLFHSFFCFQSLEAWNKALNNLESGSLGDDDLNGTE